MAHNNPRENNPPVVSANRARDAVTGHGVRFVLASSLVLVAVIFGGLWIFYFGH